MTADVARVDVSFEATQVILVYLCTVGDAIFYISSSNSLQSDWFAIFKISLLVVTKEFRNLRVLFLAMGERFPQKLRFWRSKGLVFNAIYRLVMKIVGSIKTKELIFYSALSEFTFLECVK